MNRLSTSRDETGHPASPQDCGRAAGRLGRGDRPTVVAKLSGGLGNQLFQYATARAVAEAHDAELLLDASFYDQQTDARLGYRRSLLDNLKIGAPFLGPDDAARLNRRFTAPLYRKPWLRFLDRTGLSGLPRTVSERAGRDLRTLDLPRRGIFLVGGWQSYTNFHHLRPALRHELWPARPMPASVRAYRRQIEAAPAVSVHVRRGDYLSERVRAVHGVLPMQYYEEALARLRRVQPDAVLFLFSDDPGWVRDRFRAAPMDQVVVEYEESAAEPYWDLALMRLCGAHVLANSTFGWWGAYLGPPGEERVYLPKAWLELPVNRCNALQPPGWTDVDLGAALHE